MLVLPIKDWELQPFQIYKVQGASPHAHKMLLSQILSEFRSGSIHVRVACIHVQVTLLPTAFHKTRALSHKVAV